VVRMKGDLYSTVISSKLHMLLFQHVLCQF
jgi:hypothetical protein